MTAADVMRAPADASGRTWLVLIGAVAGLFALALIALGSGRYPLTAGEVGTVVWNRLTGNGGASNHPNGRSGGS